MGQLTRYLFLPILPIESGVLLLGSFLLGNWGYVFVLSLIVGVAFLWIAREDRRRARGNRSQPATMDRRVSAEKVVIEQFEKYKR